MNYIFGSFVRELEYQGVVLKRSDLDRFENMSDILVDFESPNGDITSIDYDIKPGVCEIIVRCSELVIRHSEDRALYDVIEMADKLEFRQVTGEKEDETQLTLTINV